MGKRVLITGKNSYVGTSFIEWMSKNNPSTRCFEISVRGDDWKLQDFSSYDTVLHVAGIAHVNSNAHTDDDYYSVNTKLAIEVAKKAKQDGVIQFIFMSSIIVYNDSNIENGIITKDTIPYSKNAYGASKINAEKGIRLLEDDYFKVAILRPPMIYGPKSKGNYPKLARLAKFTPYFPDYKNKRSMIFIDNLSIFLNDLLENQIGGLFFPQNKDYVCTSDLVQEISASYGKRVRLTSVFNPLITLFEDTIVIKKVFGNLYYQIENKDTSKYYDLKKSIVITEEIQ